MSNDTECTDPQLFTKRLMEDLSSAALINMASLGDLILRRFLVPAMASFVRTAQSARSSAARGQGGGSRGPHATSCRRYSVSVTRALVLVEDSGGCEWSRIERSRIE